MSTKTMSLLVMAHLFLGIGPTLSVINILRETTMKKTNVFPLQGRSNCRLECYSPVKNTNIEITEKWIELDKIILS